MNKKTAFSLTSSFAFTLLLSAGAWAQLPSVHMPNINLQHTLPAGARTQKMKSEARDARDSSSKTQYAPTPQSGKSTDKPASAKSMPVAHGQAASGDLESLKSSISADPSLVRQVDGSGYIPLHHAAYAGDLPTTEYLISQGSLLNSPGDRGETPMYLAASKGHDKVVAALIKAGADPNLASGDGKSPLLKAAMQGHSQAVAALIAGGADVKAKDRSGKTALELAERYRENDYEKVVAQLKKASSQ